MFPLNIGLIGHGVVGEGVARLLLENAAAVDAGAGRPVRLARISDLRDFSGIAYGGLFTKDAADIVGNPGIDIVVECMGGVDPAGRFAAAALAAGQSFVTSNKQLVVERGAHLQALALKHNAHFLFEGSCGGGIPVLAPIRRSLAANKLLYVRGILNGTTNYILTRMQGGAAPFTAALAEAKRLGYAESDPTADVEGHDARRKLTILAAMCFGARFADDGRIPCEGIGRVTREDMRHAALLSRTVRLVAQGERTGEGWRGRVSPVLLPGTHPLATVSDVNNGVLVTGDRVGDVLFYGRGAGPDPTASAVVGDVIEAVRDHGRPWHARLPETTPFDQSESPSRYFFRLRPLPQVDGGAKALHILPEARISLPDDEILAGEIAIVTEPLYPAQLAAAHEALDMAGCAPSHPIRYESL